MFIIILLAHWAEMVRRTVKAAVNTFDQMPPCDTEPLPPEWFKHPPY